MGHVGVVELGGHGGVQEADRPGSPGGLVRAVVDGAGEQQVRWRAVQLHAVRFDPGKSAAAQCRGQIGELRWAPRRLRERSGQLVCVPGEQGQRDGLAAQPCGDGEQGRRRRVVD
jgi:hypothetical protein